MTATDRAAGLLQGASDSVHGVKHEARSGDRDHELGEREAAAQARWAAGQSPRNTFERDAFAALEVGVTAGRMSLDREAGRATAMEAAMTAEAEAGS